MNCLKVLVCVPPHIPTLYTNCHDKMCLSVLFCAPPNPVYQLQRQSVLLFPALCTSTLCTDCRDKMCLSVPLHVPQSCVTTAEIKTVVPLDCFPSPHASSASKDVEPQRSGIITGSGCVHPGWWR